MRLDFSWNEMLVWIMGYRQNLTARENKLDIEHEFEKIASAIRETTD